MKKEFSVLSLFLMIVCFASCQNDNKQNGLQTTPPFGSHVTPPFGSHVTPPFGSEVTPPFGS